MAAETGNTYICGIMTDSVEIPRANARFSTMTSSIKVLPSNDDNDGQPKTSILLFSIVDHCRNRLGTVLSSSARSKTPHLPLEFWWYLSYFRSYKYFRFGWSFWFSANIAFICGHFLWVCRGRRLCFFFAAGITMILRRHSAVYESAWA